MPGLRIRDEPDKTKELQAKLLAWRESINTPTPMSNTTQNPLEPAKREKRRTKKGKANK